MVAKAKKKKRVKSDPLPTPEKVWFVMNWYGKKSVLAFTKAEYHGIINNRELLKSLTGPFASEEAAVRLLKT